VSNTLLNRLPLDGGAIPLELPFTDDELRAFQRITILACGTSRHAGLVGQFYLEQLARIGVARVSIPVASILVMHRALKRFFDALHASPTGLLEGQSDWISSFAEYTEFVGLKEYRHLEDEFLPRTAIDVKYAVDAEHASAALE